MNRELRLVLLGLAAIFAVVLGAGFLLRAIRTAPRPVPVADSTSAPAPSNDAPLEPQPNRPLESPPESPPAAAAPLRSVLSPQALGAAREALEQDIAAAPDYARFFDRLKAVFPADYDSILDTLAASTQGKSIGVDELMADAVAALRHAHGTLAAKAPDAALEKIFAMQLEEMKVLSQKDTHLCVAFLYGANVPGFVGFAADHRPLVADSAIAGLEAMDAGRAHAVDHGAPSDADFQALDHALVDKGLTRPEIDALLDGKAPEPPIADPTMCAAGQTYLATLATLSESVRTRLYGLAVDLMAKS